MLSVHYAASPINKKFQETSNLAVIRAEGLFSGDRLRYCSNNAQLHWPRLCVPLGLPASRNRTAVG
jgi:hypothetical protein